MIHHTNRSDTKPIMAVKYDTFSNKHILHHFDGELAHLHHVLLKMSNLLLSQWETAIEALDDANQELAMNVVTQSGDMLNYANRVDEVILSLLAKETPVASDLRMVLAISKIAVELKYLGEEVTEIARLILMLYDPRNGIPHARLVTDLVRISQDIRVVLGNLVIVIGSFDAVLARRLLHYDAVCGREIQDAITQQLSFIHHDARQIRPALTVLQIMKSLEASGEHCKNLAEYCVYMIEGQDVRHAKLSGD